MGHLGDFHASEGGVHLITGSFVTSKMVRSGLRAKDLRLAMDMLLNPNVPEFANMRAALATAFQGLLRGAEFKVDGVFDATVDLARCDIAALSGLRLVLMMRPSKNMNYLKGKMVPLVIGAGGAYIDAVALSQRGAKHASCGPDQGRQGGGNASVSLFWDQHGKALTGVRMRAWIQMAMAAIGLDASHFLHSFVPSNLEQSFS